MIHLDANILITLPRWIRSNPAIIAEIESGVPVSVSAIVWFEFATGPVNPHEIALARAFIGNRILAVDGSVAEYAAELFNAVGRNRCLSYDCIIAATAIIHDSKLIPYNRLKFAPFVEHGLELV